MAVFLLKTLEGAGYVPPPASGTIFADVLLGDFAVDFIEDLFQRQITGGCDPGPPLRYCPLNANTRGEMAVFVTKTFNLPSGSSSMAGRQPRRAPRRQPLGGSE